MRHSAHLMLGDSSEQLLCGLKRYVQKYGNQGEAGYFNALLCSAKEQKKDDLQIRIARLKNTRADQFVSDPEKQYEVELVPYCEIPDQNQDIYAQDLLSKIYNSAITINNPGDTEFMHLCIYLPAYDEEAWKSAECLIRTAARIPQDYTIDLFLWAADTAFLFEPETEQLPLQIQKYTVLQQQLIGRMIEAKKGYASTLAHIIIMQNCNSKGLSLSLNLETLTQIIGEFALLTISRYDHIFVKNAESSERPIQALGLSMLSLDPYFFVQYLLHRIYLHILKREQVMQTEVDINKVSAVVQKILVGNVNIFSTLYKEEVEPRLNDRIDQNTIITEIKPILDTKIDALTKDFQSYIDDPELSLPEKQAALAQLLGEDDALLVGYIFNKQQLTIHDCTTEILNLFIRENNALLEYTEPQDGVVEKNLHSLEEFAVLSQDTKEPVSLPLGELKSLKNSMMGSTTYIRQKKEELQQISQLEEEQVESQKRLTEKGFVYGGKLYRLIGNNVVERPLAETYSPSAENKTHSIDLRSEFTPVKDQGEMGACTAFAIVSIYEYILKKNNQIDPDLSERYVYYNVRASQNQEDEDCGSSYFDIIQTMSSEGVCLEHLCKYDDSKLQEKPSPEAYADGRTRLITKALNVKTNIDDIRAAIAEGYPVAISLKIGDSFGQSGAFIRRPDPDEPCGNHAMVICGYSDEDKLFIVRNSWNATFGDKGYCYVPYSYIGDPDYLNMACIITQISNQELQIKGNDRKLVAAFDKTDSKIRAAILRNLIGEEEFKLKRESNRYEQLSNTYNLLVQRLCNNNNREILLEGTLQRLNRERNQLSQTKNIISDERSSALKAFDRRKNGIIVAYAIIIVVAIIVYAGLTVHYGLSILTHRGSILGMALLGIGTVLFVLWLGLQKHRRGNLDEEYQNHLDHDAREIASRDKTSTNIHLKMHIAGMILDSQSKLHHNLKSKYHGMQCYVGNLKTWYDEELTKSRNIPEITKDPFLTILSLRQLDQYFDTRKEEITKDIRLYAMLHNRYDISDEAILEFQNNLRDRMIQSLTDALSGFNIYEYITGKADYPYLQKEQESVDERLKQMELKSNVFLRLSDTITDTDDENSYVRLILAQFNRNEGNTRWENLCEKNFQNKVSIEELHTPYKILLCNLFNLKPGDIYILKKSN